MNDLLTRHPGPVLAPDPSGPEWQRGSTFNPSVLRFGDGSWRMLFRATATTEFGVAGAYASRIGVADSDDGIHWRTRTEPLISPTLPEELGLGCEDPRATVIAGGHDAASAVIRVLYTGAELRQRAQPRTGPPALATNGDAGARAAISDDAAAGVGASGDAVLVRVMQATVRHDLTTVEKHGVFLRTGSPDRIRLKAAALFPDPLPDGRWPFVFTFGSESPYGTLMYVDDLTIERQVERPPTEDDIARMFVNDPARYVLLGPPTPVERGPEVGAPPLKVGTDYVLFHCPANRSAVRQWGTGALLVDGATRRVKGCVEDLLVPETREELRGVVDNVAFPSAAVHLPETDEVRVYYGAGDRGTFMATGRMSRIVAALEAAPYTAQGPH